MLKSPIKSHDMTSLPYLLVLPHALEVLPPQLVVTLPEGCRDDGTVYFPAHIEHLPELWQVIQGQTPFPGGCQGQNDISAEPEIKYLREGVDMTCLAKFS